MLLSSLDEAEYDEDQSERELLLPPARKALLADTLTTTDRTDGPAVALVLMLLLCCRTSNISTWPPRPCVPSDQKTSIRCPSVTGICLSLNIGSLPLCEGIIFRSLQERIHSGWDRRMEGIKHAKQRIECCLWSVGNCIPLRSGTKMKSNST